MSKRMVVLPFIAATIVLSAAGRGSAQTADQALEPAPSRDVVPQSIRFSGVSVNRAGDTLEAVFRIYAGPEGGEPLWSETQRIAIDRDGNYTVLLGAASESGLPQSLFAGGKPRWLGISMERAPEQPRIALVSVAYAMKAADAETLSGVPASEFVTRSQLRSTAIEAASAALAQAGAAKGPRAALPGVTPTGSGTANAIPIWKTSSTLGNSVLAQSGAVVNVKGAILAQPAPGNPTALIGESSATVGRVYGVYGTAVSDFGGSAGVGGYQNAKAGVVFGVSGTAISTTTNAAGVSGVESATAGQVFGVSGTAASKTTGAAGVSGISNSTTGDVSGVQGMAASSTTFAAGVYGVENAKSGQVYGVSGEAYSTGPGAAAVRGHEHASSGGAFGVIGVTESAGPYAAGVVGNATASSGLVFGVYGQTSTATAQAAGVSGIESATSGEVFGVLGTAKSSTQYAAGVNGVNSASVGQVFGVSGTAASSSTNAMGVAGYESAATGQVYGVDGYTASTPECRGGRRL